MKLDEIQHAIRDERLDGWLFFDHHLRDPLAYRVLRFDAPRTPTRRWYYFIPAAGEPRGLVHRVERTMLDGLPGEKTHYSSWKEQVDGLRKLLGGARRVAMQYSPNCAIPYVSMVDGGTIDLVRSLDVAVAGSENLIQFFEARWTDAQLESHLEAGRRVDEVRRAAFKAAFGRLRSGERVEEFDIKMFILERFAEAGLFTDHGPIVAVNDNASNPHYEPAPDVSREIREGDLLLIDLWAKLENDPAAVYYDITWTGFCGSHAPSAMENIFEIVRQARDRAVNRVTEALASGEAICGYQVDDAARGYIRERGFEEHFVHRTGHSIGMEVHGSGANMDNLETHDERRIIPRTCFSIEPGIYLTEFGVRSEVNVYAGEGAARVTGEVQRKLVTY